MPTRSRASGSPCERSRVQFYYLISIFSGFTPILFPVDLLQFQIPGHCPQAPRQSLVTGMSRVSALSHHLECPRNLHMLFSTSHRLHSYLHIVHPTLLSYCIQARHRCRILLFPCRGTKAWPMAVQSELSCLVPQTVLIRRVSTPSYRTSSLQKSS